MGMRAGGSGEVAGWGPRKLLGAVVGVVILLAVALGTGSEAISAEPGDRATSAAPAVKCATIPGSVTYRNERRELLAYFTMSQRSCWDGTRITYLSQPVISVGVTRVGVNSGWSYNGIAGRRDLYFEYKNKPKGGHLTSRRASFTYCGASGCINKSPSIKRYAYSDKAGFRIAQP